MTTPSAPRGRTAILAAAALALLAGCSTSTTESAPATSPATPATSSAAPTTSPTSADPSASSPAPTSSSPGTRAPATTLVSDGGLIRVTTQGGWTAMPGADADGTDELYDALGIRMAGATATVEMFKRDFVSEKEFVAEVTKGGKASGQTCERVVIGVRYRSTKEEPAVSVVCDGGGHSRLVTRLDTTHTTTLFTIDGATAEAPFDPVMQGLIHNTELRTPAAAA